MRQQNPYEPIFSSEMMEYNSIKPDDGKYRDFIFNEPTFEARFVEEFNGCQFNRVRFSGDLKKVKFIDCLFLNCDLSNVELSQSLFHRVKFDQCKGTGSVFRKSKFKFTEFSKSQFSITDFSESIFESVKMTECNFTEGAFQSCRQSDFKTSLVDFSLADFTETSLSKMDLSGCNINGLRLSPQHLKGLMVDSLQAIALVQLLGIHVKD
jgi:uncharacterized protein YjbI with pentapeptide repeats